MLIYSRSFKDAIDDSDVLAKTWIDVLKTLFDV